MKKHILLSLIFMVVISNGLAIQDSFITISDNGAGLCYAVDNKDNSVCENQTLQIDGTSDHGLYILPETILKPNSTVVEHLDYAFFIPMGILSTLMFFGIVFGVLVLVVIVFGTLMGLWKK